MKRILILIVFILLLVGLFQVIAQERAILSSRLNEVIQLSIDKNRIPGLAVTAVKNGEIVYSSGFNGSWSKSDREITIETPFYIGSISKSFTALAIMQLVEAKKIDLDSPVQDYLPEFRVDDTGFEGVITVRHLLHHRSGLTEEEYFKDLPGELSIEAGVKDLYGMRLSHNPGERFSYFNPNYNILGLIVEKVSNQSFDTYLSENILYPLEMNNTYLNEEGAAKVVSGHGAVFSIPIQRAEEYKAYSIPSGYIVSTASDMANYLLYHLSGEFNGRKLLSEEYLNILQTPFDSQETGYAMGWNKGVKFNQPVVEHGGSLFNYSANLAFLPESETGLVLLINQNHFIYSIISNNQLVDNMLRVLLNPELSTAEINVIPLGNIFIFLAVIALLTIFKEIYELLNLDKWEHKMNSKSRLYLYINIIMEFLIPAFLLIGIPMIISTIFGRALSPVPAFQLMPGVTSWVIIVSVLSVFRGTLKINKLFNNKDKI
ncbi:MAG: serine hydrolase domain-containing protein [Bacillota bacterium]